MTEHKIGELIEVPQVRTVIQMSDIDNPELRDFLTESFLITEEVQRVFNAFFNRICQGEGKGFFIIGNYGSGKSHLLSVLSLLLSYDRAWEPLLNQEKGLAQYHRQLSQQKFIVLNLSLVGHSNKEYLEDIVIDGITDFLSGQDIDVTFNQEQDFIESVAASVRENHSQKLQRFLQEQEMTAAELFQPGQLFLVEQLLKRLNLPYRFNYDRRQIFDYLEEIRDRQGYAGIVILIDELSEFLRSKPDGRRFNEDIRFLQFLSESSDSMPLWITATLQEEIEKTGGTVPQAFNKIKDRYLTRFHLTGAHIRELVHQRLIHLKEGAAPVIEDVYSYYRSFFNDWPVTAEDFKNLYPVHPMAIDLLDNLKPLFSQHRGIIDFIHYQLRGSSDRSIEGMLDKPAHQLLTPDRIFDHFLDRIRDTTETSSYYEKVYRYYEQEMSSLLQEEEMETGFKLIKLLILFSISPVDKEYTVKDMADMVLEGVTELEPAANYEYINDSLQRLCRQGAYIIHEEREGDYEDSYHIDLEADVNLIIDQKTDYIKSNLFENDPRLFTRLGSKIKNDSLPLADFFQEARTGRTVYWQNTRRKGYRIFMPLTDIAVDDMEKMGERLQHDEYDFAVIIAHPLQVKENEEYLREILLPEINSDIKESLLFWLPRELGKKDFLAQVLARELLLDEYKDDPAADAQQIRQTLEHLLQEDWNEVEEIITSAYFKGDIIDGTGSTVDISLNTIYKEFKDFFQDLVSRILNKRYPRHVNISPYQSVLGSRQIEEMEEKFLEPGQIEDFQDTGNLKKNIDAFLKPMNLIKQTRKSYRLQVKPDKNPLLKAFFSCLQEEKTKIDDIYWQLRKGPYGLSWTQFKLLVLVLLYSGYITAYSQKQKISLTRLNAGSFKRIAYIGYGEIIDNDFQLILKNCALLPPRFKKQPFSLPLQHEIWDYLVDLKRELDGNIDDLKQKLNDLSRRGVLADFDLKQMSSYLENAEELLDEIKVSYPSDEGLEKFASCYRNLPHIDQYLERMEKIREFINDRLTAYRRIKNYLEDSQLQIPETEKYQDLMKFHQNLLQSLRDEAIIFEDGFFSDLEKSFREFQQQYISRYFEEHNRQLAGDRFQPYQKIKESKGYQILSQLAAIDMISVKDDLVKADRMISEVLRRQCRQLSRERLQGFPACSCGFSLGEKVELTPVKEIRQILDRGIIQYLETLSSLEYREKLTDYLDNMEAVGEKRFARPIRELLQIDPQASELISRLQEKLNRNVIKRINEALGESISIIERDLDQLYENLVDRSFSPEQVRKIFHEWLTGAEGISDNTYIKIKGREQSEASRTEKPRLEDFLDKYFPELLPLFDDIGPEELSLLLVLNQWQHDHELQDQELQQIAGDLESFQKYWGNESLRYSFSEMCQQLFRNEHRELRKELIAAADTRLEEGGLIESLLDMMSLTAPVAVVRVLVREHISQLLLEKLLENLVRIVENNSNISQLQQAMTALEMREDDESGSENREGIMELTHTYLKLQAALFYLKQQTVPSSYKDWENAYQEYLSSLELYLSRLQDLSQKLGMAASIPLQMKAKEIREVLFRYQNKYEEFNEGQPFSISENMDHDILPDIAALVTDKYSGLLQKLKAETGFRLLIDGMRWDLWKLIKKHLRESISLRLIDEGSLQSLPPTNTEHQLQLIKDAGFDGEVIGPEEFTGEKDDIIKFGYIDDKIHSSKDNYSHFIEEIIFQTENRLIPFIKRLPSGSPLLIFADHGYRINNNFRRQDKYETPRYLHGSDTFDETIVPWAFLYKI